MDWTAKNDVADTVQPVNHVTNSVECVIVVVRMDTSGINVIDVSFRKSNSSKTYSAVTLIWGVITCDSQGEN